MTEILHKILNRIWRKWNFLVIVWVWIRLNLQSHGTEKGTACIIFSKDRPLQLYGLLTTMSQHLAGLKNVHIIYAASSAEYENSYQQVFQKFSLIYQIRPIRQYSKDDFREKLLHSFSLIGEGKTFFLVDDIFFKNSFDLAGLDAMDGEKYIFSMRLHPGINWSYTQQQQVVLPKLENIKIANTNFFTWLWTKEQHEWGYPLSVDGHVFDTKEIFLVSSALDYNTPNSFEAALQKLSFYFCRRPGLCLADSLIVNVPLNRVQDDFDNLSMSVGPEELLKRWIDGFEIDTSLLHLLPNKSCHEELKVQYRLRTDLP